MHQFFHVHFDVDSTDDLCCRAKGIIECEIYLKRRVLLRFFWDLEAVSISPFLFNVSILQIFILFHILGKIFGTHEQVRGSSQKRSDSLKVVPFSVRRNRANRT